jgi:threonine dehydratase
MTDGFLERADFERAREVIRGRVHRTPTMSAGGIGAQLGLRLHLKAEVFQKTGSFKVRGVLNKLSSVSTEDRARGLVSMSAGNHAAALSWGAGAAGARATIVMPDGAAPSKIEATRGYGGEVVLTGGDLMEAVHDLERRRGLLFVHPYDDPAIMAGHGTIGLEILEDLPDVETVIVPIGGGGLIGGIAAALKHCRPGLRIIGVEPHGADAMTRALDAGAPVPIPRPSTIADGLGAPFAGRHTLRHVQRFVDQVVRVGDDSIAAALRLIVTRAKLAAEPSGAAPLAALLEGGADLRGSERVLCVVSGGNVDPDVLARLLAARSG